MSNALNQQTMRVREEKDNIVPSKELKISGGITNTLIYCYTFWRAYYIDGILLEWMECLVAYEWYKPNAITFRESIMIPQVRSEIDFRGEVRIQQTSWNCDGR